MLTVRDVWRGALPDGTELLAGGAGLERRVEWATALRTRPPAFDAVKGGELAFIPVRSIRLLDERLDLASVMASLGEKGGVAVAIVGDASADAIAIADRMLIPLLRLPSGVSLPDLVHSTVRFILEQRTELHEQEERLRRELTDLALQGAGVAAITDRLAAVTGSAAAWVDEDGAVLHATSAEAGRALGSQAEALQRWMALTPLSAADPPVRELDGEARGGAAPIGVRDRIVGWIGVTGGGDPLSQLSRVAVARAAAAAAIEVDRERAVLEVRDDLEGEFMTALTEGAYASEEAIAERAGRLGIALDSGLRVAVIHGIGRDGDRAVAVTRKALETAGSKALVGRHREHLCILFGPGGGDAAGLSQRLVDDLSALLSGRARPHAGISRETSGAAAVRAAHSEAEQAASTGRRFFGPGRAVDFGTLGLHRLLGVFADHPELSDFVSDTIGRLAQHDQRGRAELLPTLEAFFACNLSPTETAQRLGLHRNTVMYRLRRVEEVGGVSLDDPMTRLTLHLALVAREVAGTSPRG